MDAGGWADPTGSADGEALDVLSHELQVAEMPREIHGEAGENQVGNQPEDLHGEHGGDLDAADAFLRKDTTGQALFDCDVMISSPATSSGPSSDSLLATHAANPAAIGGDSAQKTRTPRVGVELASADNATAEQQQCRSQGGGVGVAVGGSVAGADADASVTVAFLDAGTIANGDATADQQPGIPGVGVVVGGDANADAHAIYNVDAGAKGGATAGQQLRNQGAGAGAAAGDSGGADADDAGDADAYAKGETSAEQQSGSQGVGVVLAGSVAGADADASVTVAFLGAGYGGTGLTYTGVLQQIQGCASASSDGAMPASTTNIQRDSVLCNIVSLGAPAVGDGLELPGGGAAALSEISPCEPLYGDLIDEQHSEQLQGEAMIIGAVSSAEQRREVCVSRILAEIQAGGGAAAALNESSTANAAASAADGANADSTTTMTAATRAFPLALASYGDAILRRSMNDLESLRCRHDDEDQVDPDDGGLRKIWGRNDTTGHSQSYHTGESFICPPATSSFQISGASFEALRAAHAAYPAEMDLTRAHHSDHRIFESETLLMGGETVRPDRQTATALRLGVDSSQSQRPWCGSVPRDPSQWDDPLEAYGDAQRDAADAANAVCMNALSAADAGVNFEATAEQLRESQGAGADVAAGDIARAGDGGTGMTLTGLLKQMKQRKRHAGASGHIDGARPASTTDMAQDPEALCKIVSLRDTASENSSSGSSSTAADEEGASSNSGLGDGDRSSSPLSGIAQALSDAALDEPESPAYAEAVTHAVTAPNPTPTETANMRTRVLFAAETAVTLVPAMPALSEGPTSQESIRRKAIAAEGKPAGTPPVAAAVPRTAAAFAAASAAAAAGGTSVAAGTSGSGTSAASTGSSAAASTALAGSGGTRQIRRRAQEARARTQVASARYRTSFREDRGRGRRAD
ncbi:unnamed protein product [Closterium sp. NIES-53]